MTAEPPPRWKLLLEVYDYARLRAKPEVTRSTPLRKLYEGYERRLLGIRRSGIGRKGFLRNRGGLLCEVIGCLVTRI